MGSCGCEPDFARPGITPCNVAGIDPGIFSRPVSGLQDFYLLEGESADWAHGLAGLQLRGIRRVRRIGVSSLKLNTLADIT